MSAKYTEKNGKSRSPGTQGALWRPNARPAVECRWSDVDAVSIRHLVDAVTRRGGAVMFGLTSDGGAFSICVLQDAEKIKEYPHGIEECQDLLVSIAAWYSEVGPMP